MGKEGKNDFGFNASTEVYENLYKAGVIDPTKVTRIALENAACYHGRYFVLMGALSPLDGIGPSELKLDKESNTGEKGVFSNPDSSYAIAIYYKYDSRAFLGLESSNITYTDYKLGSAESELDSDQATTYATINLIWGLWF